MRRRGVEGGCWVVVVEEEGGWGVRERWVLRMSIAAVLMGGEGVGKILVEGGDQAARSRKMALGTMAWMAMRRRALMTRDMGEGVGIEAGVGARRGEGGMIVDIGEKDTVV